MGTKTYDPMTLDKPSRRVTGMTVALDGCLNEPILDIMARIISDDELVGELHDMNKLLYGLSDQGYELVKVDTK